MCVYSFVFLHIIISTGLLRSSTLQTPPFDSIETFPYSFIIYLLVLFNLNTEQI